MVTLCYIAKADALYACDEEESAPDGPADGPSKQRASPSAAAEYAVISVLEISYLRS